MFHVRPEHGVHSRLIAGAVAAEPGKDIGVDAERDGSLHLRHHGRCVVPEVGRQIAQLVQCSTRDLGKMGLCPSGMSRFGRQLGIAQDRGEADANHQHHTFPQRARLGLLHRERSVRRLEGISA